MYYLLRGIFIGLLFGVPVGAIGALTVQRTFNFGIKAGFITGLGSSLADCIYACIGVFGFTLVSDFLLQWQNFITLIGSIFIIYIGIKSIKYKDNRLTINNKSTAKLNMLFTSFAIGITNPVAILTFLFAFSYFGISNIKSFQSGIFIVLGVFAGTYFWWITLTIFTLLIKYKTNEFNLHTINKIFGFIMCLFGAIIIFRIFTYMITD